MAKAFAAAMESHAGPCGVGRVNGPSGKHFDLGLFLGGTVPLKLDGVIEDSWQAGRLSGLLNTKDIVDLQLTWHASDISRSSTNNSIISPAARELQLGEAIQQLRLGVSGRGGHHAFIHQSDLSQQPGLKRLEAVKRVLDYVGGHLFKVTMWLGDASMLSTLHQHDEYHNVLLLLSGRKRVLLLPPASASELDLRAYVEERWTYDAVRGGLSTAPSVTGRTVDHFANVFADSEDSTRLERIAASWSSASSLLSDASGGMICALKAGEALYIPHSWAHAVISEVDPDDGFGLNVAVNVWFKTPDRHSKELLWKLAFAFLGLGLIYLARNPHLLPGTKATAETPRTFVAGGKTKKS